MISFDGVGSGNANLQFTAVMTREQINSLEDLRQEGALQLHLELEALICIDDDLKYSRDPGTLSAKREDWLKALSSDAGFRQTLMFEVPFPKNSENIEETIQKAQSLIENGHYKDAIARCRLIIEGVEIARGDKRKASEANKMAHEPASRQSMTEVQRLLSLREQLKNVCQLGAHGDSEFTRSQAKAVLGMTMVLLAEPSIAGLE